MTSINIGSRDITWSYANLALTSLVNLSLLPLILWALTPAEVGLWFVFSAMGSLAVVLDFGLMSTLSRHVTFAWCGAESIEKEGYQRSATSAPNPNYSLLSALLNASRMAYALITLIVVLLAGTVGALQVSRAIERNGGVAHGLESWFVFVLAIMLNVFFGYWNAMLRGVGAVAQSSQANIVGKLVQLVLTAAALISGLGLMGVALAYLISSLAFRSLSVRMFRAYVDAKRTLASIPSPSPIERLAILKLVWPNSYRQGLVGLSQYGLAVSPVLIASSFLTLELAGAVGLTMQLLSLFKVIGNALFNAYLPMFAALRMQERRKELVKRFSLSLGTSAYFILSGGVLLNWAARPFLSDFGYDNVLLAPGPFIVLLIGEWLTNQYALCCGYLASGNRVPMHLAYVVTCLVTVGTQIVAVGVLEWGIWGIVVPSLATCLAYNGWHWFWRVAEEMRIASRRLALESLVEPVRWGVNTLRKR